MVLISLLLGNDYNKHLVNFKNILTSYKLLLKEGKGFLFKKNGYLNFRNILILLKNLEDNNSSDVIYSQNNVNKYFNSLLWNLNLYNGVVVPNYLPNYKINVKTILAYFPKKIKKNYLIPKWQDTDVYLLLLMPSVGKDFLPDHLKKFMEPKSAIRDLFPDPCSDCIDFKNKISSFNENTNTEIVRVTNEEYKKIILKKIIKL